MKSDDDLQRDVRIYRRHERMQRFKWTALLVSLVTVIAVVVYILLTYEPQNPFPAQ